VQRAGYIYVGLGSVLFATTGIASKISFDAGVAPSVLAAWRSYGAALLLLPAVLLAVRSIRRGDILPLALFGVIGVTIAQGLYFEAIDRIDIAIAIVIVYTGPIPIAIFERLRLDERLPLRAYSAMVAAVVGVVFAVLAGSGAGGGISAAGLLFAVGTLCAYVGQILLAARQPRRVPPLARVGVAMLASSVAWAVLVPPWSSPIEGLGDAVPLGGDLPWSIPLWVAVGWVILVGTVGAYVLLVAGSPRIGAGAASMVSMTEPIAAPILAWGVLGQSLTALQVGGLALTIACVAIVERARLAQRRAVG
jgi:drug/metabolite transporter (DMT)-like permease